MNDNPTSDEQKWTPRDLQVKYQGRYAGVIPWCAICEDHNAILAAEREVEHNQAVTLGQHIARLEDQLAAERKGHEMDGQLISRQESEIAAEREKNELLREELNEAVKLLKLEDIDAAISKLETKLK